MKKVKCFLAFLCVSVSLVILFTVSAAMENPFSDVREGSWYYGNVIGAYEKGYISGTSKNTFSPDSVVRRRDLITMLAVSDGVRKDLYAGPSEFADVPRGSYYFEYINWAFKYGIVSGTSEHIFSPDKPVTREEMCVIIGNYCDYCGYSLYAAKYPVSYTDSKEISGWAKQSADFCSRANLMCGYGGRFNPKGKLSRAQAVTVIEALNREKMREAPDETADIGSSRQLLFEDYYIDSGKSTSEICTLRPLKKEEVFEFSALYERNGAVYQNIVKAPDGKYRMYYKATDPYGQRRICFIESQDGIEWTRPTGKYPYLNRSSNIVTGNSYSPDNLFVFYDDNPVCRGTRWKGIYGQWADGLFLEYSEDGMSFFDGEYEMLFGEPGENGGMFFDTLNTMYYDAVRGKYIAFVRGFHDGDNCVLDRDFVANNPTRAIRDIRYIESSDLVSWSEPRLICYNNIGDGHMYANAVTPYFRSEGLYIGMPTRLQYVTDNDKTAEVFLMSSRDCLNWNITEQPYLLPDNGTSYVYGKSGFPCVGIIPVSDSEMSFFMAGYDDSRGCSVLYRYTLRTDGFACAKSEGESVLETKYAEIDGSTLDINFRTFSDGYISITLTDINGKSVSCGKVSGDCISRKTDLSEETASLARGALKITFKLKNAELYSFRFD